MFYLPVPCEAGELDAMGFVLGTQAKSEGIFPRVCSHYVPKLGVTPALSRYDSHVPCTVPCSGRSHATLNHIRPHPQAACLQHTQEIGQLLFHCLLLSENVTGNPGHPGDDKHSG